MMSTSIVMAAENDDALKLLKTMSDYLAGQKNFTVKFLSDVEVITPEVQKIQFSSSGNVSVSRPDKVHASRSGGYADMEMTYDGKQVSLYAKHMNTFAQKDASGTLDELIDKLQEDNVVLPGADLLLTNVYDELSKDVLSARHIGVGIVNGIECNHLAFRNRDIDWQLWIRTGSEPLPCKYVITSKNLAAAPEYTLTILEWKPESSDTFKISVPANTTTIKFAELPPIDEVPPEADGEIK